jgi:hypothetical protein
MGALFGWVVNRLEGILTRDRTGANVADLKLAERTLEVVINGISGNYNHHLYTGDIYMY